MFQFNHVQGGYYNVVSGGKYLTTHAIAGGSHDLSFDDELAQDGESQLFRIIVNLGGSVTIMSK